MDENGKGDSVSILGVFTDFIRTEVMLLFHANQGVNVFVRQPAGQVFDPFTSERTPSPFPRDWIRSLFSSSPPERRWPVAFSFGAAALAPADTALDLPQ